MSRSTDYVRNGNMCGCRPSKIVFGPGPKRRIIYLTRHNGDSINQIFRQYLGEHQPCRKSYVSRSIYRRWFGNCRRSVGLQGNSCVLERCVMVTSLFMMDIRQCS